MCDLWCEASLVKLDGDFLCAATGAEELRATQDQLGFAESVVAAVAFLRLVVTCETQ
jgi:hypothetical protein